VHCSTPSFHGHVKIDIYIDNFIKIIMIRSVVKL